MKAVAGCLLVLLSATGCLSDMGGECDMARFYQELSCSPITDTTEDTTKAGGVVCPRAYSCVYFSEEETAKCHYRGVAYPDKSRLPEQLIKDPCNGRCTCIISDGLPYFTCTLVECAEWFAEEKLSEECIRKYSVDSCCSTGEVCGKDAIAQLKTCVVEGNTYKEFQRFYHENTHSTCVCSDKWNGKTDGEDCWERNCGRYMEISQQPLFYRKCAPVFSSKGDACPITFQCPTSDMKITKGLNVRGVSAQCGFGNQTLAVGDAVDFTDCTRCECNVPPFLDCLKRPISNCQTS